MIDIEAIRARAASIEIPSCQNDHKILREDVPALIAEVERLRDEMYEWIESYDLGDGLPQEAWDWFKEEQWRRHK